MGAFARHIDGALTARRLASVVSIAFTDLGANLATGKVRGVNMAIGSIGLQRRDQCVEIASRDVLRGGADHAGAGEHSGHGGGALRTSLRSRRTVVEVSAEEHHYAAWYMSFAEMN